MQISNSLKMLIVGIFLFFPFVAVADADKFSAREAITQLPLPEVEFLDAEGEEIQLKDFLGKKIVLNFWATWCGACIAEMPAMDILQKTLENENIVFVAVSEDFKGIKKVNEFYEQENIKYLGKYADVKNRLMNSLKIEAALPVTVFIDSKGKIDSKVEGYVDWTKPEVAEYLRNLD